MIFFPFYKFRLDDIRSFFKLFIFAIYRSTKGTENIFYLYTFTGKCFF